MQHGRRLAVGDVGYQRGQVIVTRSMGCCIDADSSENAVDIKIFLAARPTAMVGTQRGAPGGAHFLKCLPLT